MIEINGQNRRIKSLIVVLMRVGMMMGLMVIRRLKKFKESGTYVIQKEHSLR